MSECITRFFKCVQHDDITVFNSYIICDMYSYVCLTFSFVNDVISSNERMFHTTSQSTDDMPCYPTSFTDNVWWLLEVILGCLLAC